MLNPLTVKLLAEKVTDLSNFNQVFSSLSLELVLMVPPLPTILTESKPNEDGFIVSLQTIVSFLERKISNALLRILYEPSSSIYLNRIQRIESGFYRGSIAINIIYIHVFYNANIQVKAVVKP